MKWQTLQASQASPWLSDPLPEIRERLAHTRTKVVVLDDDPTGTQTVHDVPVYTDWSSETLEALLREDGPIAYVLTNSRGLSGEEAAGISATIADRLAEAGRSLDRPTAIVSRSDSTLRGHYQPEVSALVSSLGGRCDGVLIAPFFEEGGRYTVDDIHYVREGDEMSPAAETEFARDTLFQYSASNLKDWVEEKTQGKVPASEVASISISAIRTGGPDAVLATLLDLQDAQSCVVNALCYRDLEVVVCAILRAEEAGRVFVYRTAASFARVRGGMDARPLLTGRDLAGDGGGCNGLVVVGSHVAKTTAQLQEALRMATCMGIEVDVKGVIDVSRRQSVIDSAAERAREALRQGRTAIVYTSREVVHGRTGSDDLAIGQAASTALVEIVANLGTRPAWVIAKGGITSSDVATKALRVQRALVLGQAIPGIPVWRTGPESLWPRLAYTVFPGNVGGVSALAEMISILSSELPN